MAKSPYDCNCFVTRYLRYHSASDIIDLQDLWIQLGSDLLSKDAPKNDDLKAYLQSFAWIPSVLLAITDALQEKFPKYRKEILESALLEK